MTREEAQELLPVIQAFAEGKAIQYRAIDGGRWYDIEDDRVSDWDANEFRIKPAPKYRPFSDAQECAAEMAQHPNFGKVFELCYNMIDGWHHSGRVKTVVLYDWGVKVSNTHYYFKPTRKADGSLYMNFEYALRDFVFTDGLPFGAIDKEGCEE